MRLRRLGFLLALATLPLACSGDDDGDGDTPDVPSFETGLSKEQRLGQLSDAERETFCEDIEAIASSYLESESLRRAVCHFGAVATVSLFGSDDIEGTRSMCRDIEDECEANGSTETVTQSSPTQCNPPSAACTATVGEIEACYRAVMAGFTLQLQSLPACSELTAATIQEVFAHLAGQSNPAVCDTVAQKCPELLADEEFTGAN